MVSCMALTLRTAAGPGRHAAERTRPGDLVPHEGDGASGARVMAPARPTARMAVVVGLVRRWGDGWAPVGAAVLSAIALVEAAFAPGQAFPLTIVLAVATTAPVAL